ncbi:MAG: 50S ribosomal protein L5 [Candidatus Micrarchaeia archaeon]
MVNNNIMRKLKIEKITVNIGVGESGENLEKAKKLLQKLTGRLPAMTKARKREQSFGIKKGENIGVKVTLRGREAEEFLGKALDAVDRKLKRKAFDRFGNFSFGIREYIDFPGARYDPTIGLVGFDVCVTIARTGSRIENRRRMKSKMPAVQRGTAEESINFMRDKFGVSIIES